MQAIAFAPDNLHLIAGDETGSVYAWHLKDAAAAPSVFRDHSTAITALTVSPDGRWLVTGSRDQSVRLRSMEYLDAGSLQDIVCAKAGRNLTQMEWQQYLGDSSVQAVCPGWPQEHTRVNDVQETWRWKFAPAIAGFLKSGLLYCLGTIFSLFVVWLGYELYERAARWWRDRST